MLKTLFDKKKRENLKENIEVVFAVATVLSFVAKKMRERQEAEDQVQVVQGHVVSRSDH